MGWSVGLIAPMAAEVTLSGRLAVPGTEPPVRLAAVRVFGFPQGGLRGAGSRTWEMEPRGWWSLRGAAGDWTVLCTGPAHFVRPCVLAVTRTTEGENRDHLQPEPRFDYACFGEKAWDPKPAPAYWQPFVARSVSVTHVGFKLATDGVDGAGPGSQELQVSIHRCTDGPPESWPAVGPARPVPEVDCGGAKSYHFSAGWHSGEVPLTVGERYAVRVAPTRDGATIQAFWEGESGEARAWRIGAEGSSEKVSQRLWMTVAGDGDGLVVSCNKRIHREFGEFAGYRERWVQTWTARGEALCALALYTATSGTQPRMEDQRIAVRLRRGGADGPPIGPEKIAAVSANYTGDAAWGVIAAVYGKDEVRLEPGSRYAAEFVTLETPETIGGFVNFKGQPNDRRPGFNPYRRHPLDPYDGGEAWDEGRRPVERDLDLQVIEYAGSEPSRR